MISEEIVSKDELIDRLRNLPNSTKDRIYGVIAELSKPYIIVKTQNGKWEIQLDELNPNVEFDVNINENESVKVIEDIDGLKKWVDKVF